MTLTEIEEYREAVRSLLRWSVVGISPQGFLATNAAADDDKLVELQVQTYLALDVPLADIKALAQKRQDEEEAEARKVEAEYRRAPDIGFARS